MASEATKTTPSIQWSPGRRMWTSTRTPVRATSASLTCSVPRLQSPKCDAIAAPVASRRPSAISVPQPKRRATACMRGRSPRTTGTTQAARNSCPPTKNAMASRCSQRIASQVSTGRSVSTGQSAKRLRRYPAHTMAAATYTEKTDEQKAICEMVRQFADEQILPNAEHYDAVDEFPEPIVEQMKELGLFGVTIPEEYGGMGLDLTTYVMIVEELSRGWISISGIVNTHFIGSYLLMKFGSEEQKQRYLPRMATGEVRAAFSLSEPELGSDVQAIKTSARKGDDGRWEINGQKMWVTNGLLSSLVFVLVKTDPDADPRHKGFTCFIAEKEPGVAENTGEYAGLTVPPKIKKLGYKGVESTELVFDGYRCPGENILGGEEAGLNKGFAQMMDALEVGRANVAARGVGIAQRALELALRYSQERKAFG